MPIAAGKMVLRAPAAAVPAPRVQAAPLAVSSPRDAAEREAVAVARQVVSMPAPAAGAIARGLRSPWVQRFAQHVQRRGEGLPRVGAQAAGEIAAARGGGAPLPAAVRSFMEPRFRADFSAVRVHTDARAARLATQMQAHAFTVGGDVFFGRGRFQPESDDGRELIAHELTHTLQQGAAVRRSEDMDAPAVRESTPEPRVQRLGISDALDYFAERAYNIPGYRMFTIVLGVNPINMSRVERSGANILRAVVEFLPGGHLITQALDNHGIFERIAGWVAQQFATLGMVGAAFRRAIDEFLDSLSWRDIFRLGSVWERAKRIFLDPIDRLIAFGRSLLAGIVGFIKDAILRPLGRLAEGTRGYDLLKAVLGFDPVTGDPVPRTPAALIGGFMRLIGQEEIWDNIQRGNAVARAWAWFQTALGELIGFVRQIPQLFVAAFRSLELMDIVLVPRAFAKLAGVFGGFIGRFLAWAGGTVWNLLEIVFSVVAPGVMVYLRRAAGAFRTILRNPVAFIGHLVRAGLTGLRQFMTNFLAHLRASLIGWLTGAMSGAGIYIPQAFNLMEIVKFVLSVLGLTWQNIRGKLVRAVGEPAVRAMEMGFDIVMTLVTQGPAAAWQRIVESLTNLREMVIEQVMTFVRDRIVTAAITRLLSMLSPVGAFIQAIIAIYNTVMFFVERLRQIAQVAAAVIDSLAAIAAGQIAAAANRVEQTMAGLLTLVISFLARLVGLGRVSDAVTNVINRVRAPIDRALDRVVEWIVNAARRLGRFVAQAGVPNDPNERLRLAGRAAIALARGMRGRVTSSLLQGALAAVRVRYGLTRIEPFERAGQWWVRATINPNTEEPLGVASEPAAAGPEPLRVSTGAPSGIRYHPQGGRARHVEGWLTSGGGRRDAGAQAAVSRPLNVHVDLLQSRGVAIRETFDAGHLVADRYGGAGGAENLVPMERRMNRSWFGAFESAVARRVAAGERIHVDVHAEYDDARPLRDLIDDPTVIPADLLQRTCEVFRAVPFAVRYRVGRRTPDGRDEELTSQVFGARRRLDMALSAAVRQGLIGQRPERAGDVFRVR